MEDRQEGYFLSTILHPLRRRKGIHPFCPSEPKIPSYHYEVFILIQTKSFWSSKKHGHDTATEHTRDTLTTPNPVQDGGLGLFWLPKEKLLSGAGPNSQGHSACSWAGVKQEQFPPAAWDREVT